MSRDCQSCRGKGDPRVKAAHDKLDEMYDTLQQAKGGVCPIDGTKATVTFFRYRGAKIAYRKCARGHIIPL